MFDYRNGIILKNIIIDNKIFEIAVYIVLINYKGEVKFKKIL